ncbi:mandelate racemase/muconate lactonizing enzyme family protein [Marinivivus vitaminiproducens]|uniref:mandelate racemase/muconate lactonizing enzyme family protein n=1 Tax=Marinivivus vitaminiproducens TaxID=3035935 RepID=UPI0027A055E7|nr:mandelate racemase/muconate lactonizing enzyme family protein [Geminicoccaceae bacterium SCSIO 64248]
MKITKLTIWDVDYGTSFNVNQHPAILRIETDQGIHGAGEIGLAYGDGNRGAIHALAQLAERHLLGRDARAIGATWDRLYRDTFWGFSPGPLLYGAISAIDNALWDIKGKALGVPVWQLLGGRMHDSVRLYANGWFRNMGAPEAAAERALAIREEGYTACKFDPFEADRDGVFMWPKRHIPREWGLLAVDRVRAVREAVGPDFDICLDIHGNLGTTDAIIYGRMLAPHRPFFYEEPVDPNNVDSMEKVSREVEIPIAGGERLYTRYQFRPFVERQAMDILQPDIGLCGGISEMMKIAALGEVYNLHVQPHNCGGPVASAAAVHAVFAMPNFIILEWFPYWPDGRYDIVQEAYERKASHGRLPAPTAPGLGIELNDDYLGRYPRIEVG